MTEDNVEFHEICEYYIVLIVGNVVPALMFSILEMILIMLLLLVKLAFYHLTLFAGHPEISTGLRNS